MTEVSTIGDLLVRAATIHPERAAVVFPDTQASYAALLQGAGAAARGLAALGVGAGDHVGLLMVNELRYIEALFGIVLLGAVAVPLNVRHRSSELSHIIDDARLRVVLTSGADTSYVDLVALLREAIGLSAAASSPQAVFPCLAHVVDLTGAGGAGVMSAAAFFAGADAMPAGLAEAARLCVRVRDPGLIIYTSGTTAHPKGCVLSHEAVTRGPVERARYRLQAPVRDVTWAAGPLFHIGSLAPFIGSIGAVGTFLADRYFDAGRAIALMMREGVTLAWPWFSAIVQSILDHPTFDAARFGALRHLFMIAPEAVVERAQTLFPQAEILQACGMTETAGVFALSGRDDSPKTRATTQGRAVPGIQLRIVDPDTGQDSAPGKMGEILVRGYCTMTEYFGKQDQTRATLDADGWLKTGDLYSMDEAGNVSFGGRLKDMIKVGGENVATMEVEAYLCSHPAVRLAEVIGVPDPRLDEVPVAFVELREEIRVSAGELIAFCTGRIASYKVPRAIHFVAPADWPMSATKVDKRILRRWAETFRPAGSRA